MSSEHGTGARSSEGADSKQKGLFEEESYDGNERASSYSCVRLCSHVVWALVQLQGVLRCAVEWRRIANNPVKAVKKPKVRRYREVRPLPPLSVERLRIAAAGRRRTHGPRDATLIAVLAYAGIRPQEAQALRWSDVRERTLLIEKAADGQGGVKSTKTGQTRTVRLLAPLAADLAEWRSRCDQAEDEDLLFPNRSGGIWNDGAWQSWHRDAWHPACDGAGIENARPYDLRHSFISLLIHEGRSVVEVAPGRALADDDTRRLRARIR
jgi:integrase